MNQHVAVQDAHRTIKGRYYLLSLDGGGKRFAQAVPCHWGIENQVHWYWMWLLGRTRICKENFGLIRRLALNLLSQDTFTRAGVKAKRLRAGWDDDYLARFLATA